MQMLGDQGWQRGFLFILPSRGNSQWMNSRQLPKALQLKSSGQLFIENLVCAR